MTKNIMNTGACHGKGTSCVLAKISGVSFALLLADIIKWSEFLIQGLNSIKKIHNAPKSRVANNKEQAFIFQVHYDTFLSLWDYCNFHCEK